MKNKHNEATLNRPNGERDIDSSFVKIDLPFYMKTIKEEEAWHKNDRNAITVFKTDCMCIVVVGMHKDAELTYHVAECVTSVQLIEGNARLQISDKTQNIGKGDIIAIHGGINYSILATEEVFFLLTMCYLNYKVLS